MPYESEDVALNVYLISQIWKSNNPLAAHWLTLQNVVDAKRYLDKIFRYAEKGYYKDRPYQIKKEVDDLYKHYQYFIKAINSAINSGLRLSWWVPIQEHPEFDRLTGKIEEEYRNLTIVFEPFNDFLLGDDKRLRGIMEDELVSFMDHSVALLDLMARHIDVEVKESRRKK